MANIAKLQTMVADGAGQPAQAAPTTGGGDCFLRLSACSIVACMHS